MAEELVRICAACEVNADKCYYALGRQDPKKGWVKGKEGFQFVSQYLCGAPSCQKLGGHGVKSRAKGTQAPAAAPAVAAAPAKTAGGKGSGEQPAAGGAKATSTRYISSNGTSSWTKYDRGERLPNTPMCTSAVPSALHTV